MDNEKKYCKYASELTVEELEGKIGPLTGKYEMRLFEIIKECIKCSPIPLVDAVRSGYYWLVEPSDPAGEFEALEECFCYDDGSVATTQGFDMLAGVMEHCLYCDYCYDFGISFSFNGIDDRHVWDFIFLRKSKEKWGYDSNMIEGLVHESWNLIEKIIVALIELGYVRPELRKPEESARRKLDFLWYMCSGEYTVDDIDRLEARGQKYETYEVKHHDNRINRLMEYLKEKIPPLQYGLFKYNVMSGVLCEDTDPEEEESRQSLHLPYSEFEYKILCMANYNYHTMIKKEVEEVLEILLP